MENTTIKNSDDHISDAIDSFMAGDREMAEHSLHKAIESKFINHMCECLNGVYGKASTSSEAVGK